MCATCGCSDDTGTRVTDPDHVHAGHSHDHSHDHEHEHGTTTAHDHAHDHDHAHEHPHREDEPRPHTITLEQDVLAKNALLAERNRGWFAGRSIVALNLMSSPGSGKTTLLERTIRDLGPELPMAVVEGDQETLLDADRIRATGCRVVQINTGSGCHLDAAMLADGLRVLDPPSGSVLMIENVGNLVCPALFDLGERARVVIMSVTEGADKPLKYPHMFRTADVVLLNKVDLAPHVDFDRAVFDELARRVQPDLEVLPISATRGDGLDAWYRWLRAQQYQPV